MPDLILKAILVRLGNLVSLVDGSSPLRVSVESGNVLASLADPLPVVNYYLLLEDGSSKFLLEDGTSFLLLEA